MYDVDVSQSCIEWVILLSTDHCEALREAPSFPLTNHRINLFIAYIEMLSLSRNTARTYLSALGHLYRLAGVADPMATFTARKMVEMVCKGCVSSPLHKPVTYHMLSEAFKTISNQFPTWESTMYNTLLSTAFHLCASIGAVARSNGSVKAGKHHIKTSLHSDQV